MTQPLPILVLAGSDATPGPIPRGMQPGEMLSGFKGTLPLASGKPLAAELVDRLRQSGCFAEPRLVGPRRIFAPLVDVEVLDVEGSLAQSLARLRTWCLQELPKGDSLAVCACDILPTPQELQQLMAEHYQPHRESVFWGEFVTAAPAAMGASGWKPAYRFLAADGAPESVYPGHLFVIRPAALRLRLIGHLLQLAYRYRNLPLARRPLPMLWHGLGRLLREDLAGLARGKAPTLALGIPWHALRAYFRYRRGRLSFEEFERRLAKVLVHRHDQHSGAGRPVVFSLTTLLSLAKDLDTWAELREVCEPRPAAASS